MSAVPDIVSRIFGGEPVTRQAVYQWASKGRLSKTGAIVFLKTETVCGVKHTTLENIKEFVEAL